MSKETFWSLQDAKNKLSAVVESASQGKPQVVTKRGVEKAVIVSIEEYQHLKSFQKQDMPSFNEFLLSMPKDNVPFERVDVKPRDFDV